jgi:serine phosphatase RsbU (regulator of sigma subunit)
MSKPLILFVDDSRTIRFQIRKSFEQDDNSMFDLVESEDGLQAMRWLYSRPSEIVPDLIILDRNMPHLTGDDVIRILKSDKIWKQIPVLILTTHGEIDEIVKGLSDLQADEYLAKPFSPQELVARAKALIRIKLAENEARRLSEDLQKSLELQHQAQIKIEAFNKQITDSIEYASLIQKALIPEVEMFGKHFDDYFVIWSPRDVVGGDIYLFEEMENGDCLLMVIDCTGHGVPGAFVTMLVKAIKEQLVTELKNSETQINPAEILSTFNRRMKRLLKQEDKNSDSNAGFDGGILYYKKEDQKVIFAGAETPLYLVQNGECKRIKGDRHSIGYKKSDANYEFTNHTIDVSGEIRMFLSTDGYLDQNGGEKGFPFGRKKFQKLLELNHEKPFIEQQEILLSTIEDYRGGSEKNDDMTVIGIRFN